MATRDNLQAFAHWLEEHIEVFSTAYVTLRREQGDTRPEAHVRALVDATAKSMVQAIRGTVQQWEDTIRVIAEQTVRLGGAPLTGLIEGVFLFHQIVRQTLDQEQPAHRLEWRDVLNEYVLAGNRVVSEVFEDTWERQKAQSEALYRISRELNAARNADEILEVLKSFAVECGAVEVALQYADVDETGKPVWVEIAAIWRDADAGTALPVGTRIYLPEFPLGSLWLDNPKELLLVSDFDADERLSDEARAALAQLALRAMAVIPLSQAQAGRWVGFIAFSWNVPHEFSEQEMVIYNAFMALAAPAVENCRLVANLEQLVEERTALSNAAINSLPGVFYVFDVDGKFLLWNETFKTVSGYTEEELAEKTPLDFFDPDERERIAVAVRAVFEQGEVDIEANFLSKDGTLTPCLFFGARAVLSGKPCLVGMGIDITEQRRIEAERERLQQQIIEAQQSALRELSTPIVPVIEGVIVMPMIGGIDSARAREITRALLAGITEHRAKVVILDITGVPFVDSGVADHLNKSLQAARLKGCRTIITGISDAVAETVVDLGINWSQVGTLRDLQSGLLAAIQDLGITLR